MKARSGRSTPVDQVGHRDADRGGELEAVAGAGGGDEDSVAAGEGADGEAVAGGHRVAAGDALGHRADAGGDEAADQVDQLLGLGLGDGRRRGRDVFLGAVVEADLQAAAVHRGDPVEEADVGDLDREDAERGRRHRGGVGRVELDVARSGSRAGRRRAPAPRRRSRVPGRAPGAPPRIAPRGVSISTPSSSSVQESSGVASRTSTPAPRPRSSSAAIAPLASSTPAAGSWTTLEVVAELQRREDLPRPRRVDRLGPRPAQAAFGRGRMRVEPAGGRHQRRARGLDQLRPAVVGAVDQVVPDLRRIGPADHPRRPVRGAFDVADPPALEQQHRLAAPRQVPGRRPPVDAGARDDRVEALDPARGGRAGRGAAGDAPPTVDRRRGSERVDDRVDVVFAVVDVEGGADDAGQAARPAVPRARARRARRPCGSPPASAGPGSPAAPRRRSRR